MLLLMLDLLVLRFLLVDPLLHLLLFLFLLLLFLKVPLPLLLFHSLKEELEEAEKEELEEAEKEEKGVKEFIATNKEDPNVGSYHYSLH
jgi:hypothetical protein